MLIKILGQYLPSMMQKGVKVSKFTFFRYDLNFGLNIDFTWIINRTKIICRLVLYQKGSIHNLTGIYIFKEDS